MSQKGKVVRKSSTQKITIDSAVLDLLFWRFTDHHLRTSAAGALLRRTFRVSMGQNEIVAPKKAIKYSYFLGYIMLYPHFRLCIIWWGIFYLGPKFANFRGTQFLKSEKNMSLCDIMVGQRTRAFKWINGLYGLSVCWSAVTSWTLSGISGMISIQLCIIGIWCGVDQ